LPWHRWFSHDSHFFSLPPWSWIIPDDESRDISETMEIYSMLTRLIAREEITAFTLSKAPNLITESLDYCVETWRLGPSPSILKNALKVAKRKQPPEVICFKNKQHTKL
jgi:hypothetical protein